MWYHWVAWAALAWYAIVISVITFGITQLYKHLASDVPTPVASQLPASQVPHVTVIRPIVGSDPYLYECLASTFRQHYPAAKLSVHFCIPTRDEPALAVLERLLVDFPDHDARIYVAEEDPVLARGRQGNGDALGGEHELLGPNPKIRNMSRAYREAPGEVIWIIDCNVWVGPSVGGLMVDRLCGFGEGSGGQRKFKFAHQLPLAVDVSELPISTLSSTSDVSGAARGDDVTASLSNNGAEPMKDSVLPTGNRLEEMFLSTSHAKFYTGIATAAIAPCTVGKSNMFRKAHLDALTPSTEPGRSPGIDFFSDNICEDHLISDLLWKSAVPQHILDASLKEGQAEGSLTEPQGSWGNHALVVQPPCIQPLAGLSIWAYAARRSRWLRVRKYTVPAATAVEPGTESFVANALGSFAVTTLPYFRAQWGIPQTWTAFWAFWLTAEVIWCLKDWLLWGMLQSWEGEGRDTAFVGYGFRRRRHEGFWLWFKAWLGRESLAFVIWAWAIFGGATVVWRGKTFWVDMKMKVHEVIPSQKQRRV